MKQVLATLLFMVFSCCHSQVVYKTENLLLHQISGSVYVHESFLQTQEYGRVSCNGMVVISNGEAAIIDTPSESVAAIELMNWVERDMESQIKAVVVNHHHVDCLGSLDEFHQKGINSYSSDITWREARKDDYTAPKVTFSNYHELQIGGLTLINQFFGAAHAQGNIVTYVSGEEVLFGGCMVKSLKAGKGNLGDADVELWPATIKKIKRAFPTVRHVIPGHGKVGGSDLLDYTIQMFEPVD